MFQYHKSQRTSLTNRRERQQHHLRRRAKRLVHNTYRRRNIIISTMLEKNQGYYPQKMRGKKIKRKWRQHLLLLQTLLCDERQIFIYLFFLYCHYVPCQATESHVYLQNKHLCQAMDYIYFFKPAKTPKAQKDKNIRQTPSEWTN